MQNLSKKQYLLILFVFVTQCLSSGPLITLTPAKGVQNPATVTMYNSSSDQPYNISFLEISSFYNCSINIMYTYRQTPQLFNNDTDYQIVITNLSSLFIQNQTSLQISASTAYSVISPLINGSTRVQCIGSPDADNCTLNMQNGCPSSLDFFHYFDIMRIEIEGFEQVLSYNVYCNVDFLSNTFQWGLLIQIILSTVLVFVVAIYSNAWSIAGIGVSINIRWAIGFNIVLIIGGIVAIFYLPAVNIAVLVLSWFFGILGVGLCANQLLFLIKTDMLRKKIISLKTLQLRVMQILSLIIGLGVVIGWWMSDRNWIVNDIVAVCMIVAGIKFFKFTSLKYAIICFCCTITIQMIFVLLIRFFINASYNTAILNQFNNPFQLQAPTINPVYNQKCSWLPITALIYPGCLMAYLRRFDSSRNTSVYLITSVVCFFGGSLLWMFVTIISPESWPFGLIAEPANLALVAFFAWKRKEIRTLWTGKFYDEEFANKEGLKNINDLIADERKSEIQYQDSLFKGLHIGDEESVMQSLGGSQLPRPQDFSPIGINQNVNNSARPIRPQTHNKNSQKGEQIKIKAQKSDLPKKINFEMQDYGRKDDQKY